MSTKEIEVGMYVRTKYFGIQKFVNEDKKHYYFGENKKDIALCCLKNEFQRFLMNFSFNIIDLIEVGDYVNGMKVCDIRGTRYDSNDLHCYCNDNYKYNEDYELKQVMISAKDIKTICTKEQFKNCEYKIGEM